MSVTCMEIQKLQLTCVNIYIYIYMYIYILYIHYIYIYIYMYVYIYILYIHSYRYRYIYRYIAIYTSQSSFDDKKFIYKAAINLKTISVLQNATNTFQTG